MNIYNKTAVITGGAQGLGKGFARAILEEKGNVCRTETFSIGFCRSYYDWCSTNLFSC